MKRHHLFHRSNFRAFILVCILILFSAPVLVAQFSAKAEKSIDDYYTELVKVYKIIETEEVDLALKKIEELKPSIEKKARILADLAADDPGIFEILDDEDSFEIFLDKPFYKELMRIAMNEDFNAKLMASPELQMKLDEVENIIEDYMLTFDESHNEPSELSSGIAFSITLNGKGKFTGTYSIIADFEEGAIAYIDDLEYLRIDINGEIEGQEAIVSFFVENTGTGRQDWETEGHFVFEMMDQDGDLLMSLWGSEEKGYFDIESADGPGGFVTGKILGDCMDGEGDSDNPIPITASFRVKYIENIY